MSILGGHDLVTPFAYGGTWSQVSRTNVSGIWNDVGGLYGITIDLINQSEGGELTTRFEAANVVLKIVVTI